MKKILFSLSILCTLSGIAIAQDDLQWFIRNGMGKDGLIQNTSPPASNFNVTDIDTGVFNIREYRHPRTPRGKNDFFVIYADGTHYNSRTDVNFFPAPAQLPSQVISHNFRIPPGKRVVVLYATRRYEDDDPPEKIKLSNHPDASASIYDLGVTTTDSIITANHAVVRNRDITLIINLSSLRSSFSPGLAMANSASGPYKLRLEKITDNSGNPKDSIVKPCFTPSPIFSSTSPSGTLSISHILPESGLSAIQGTNDFLINTSITSPFLYVNLRPTENLNNLFSDENGNQVYNAHFEIQDAAGTTVARLVEPLLEAFDPNLVRINKVCKPRPDNIKFVEYHVEFENTGTRAVTSGLSVTLALPPHIIDLCTEEKSWVISGQPFSSRITRTNCQNLFCTRSDFRIEPVGDYALDWCGSIDGNPTPATLNCKGILTIRARLQASADIGNLMPASALMPATCTVKFGPDNTTPLEIVTTTQVLHPAFGPGPILPRLIQVEQCEACDQPIGWIIKNLRLALAGMAIIMVTLLLFGKVIRRPKPPVPNPLG